MQVVRQRKKTPVTLLAVSIGFALQAQALVAMAQDPAQATEAPAAAPAEDAQTFDTMVVTGYRASLERAVDIKRGEAGVVDAIVAEDIADFPDLNLAESLQRIPGVSITREGGEGRNISVRGLGPQFTRVRINGIEGLATGGGTDTSGGVNRGRSFDFNTFASDLFTQLVVRKTSAAEIEEGSLGATVDLRTARPFDYDGFTMAIGGQMGYGSLAKEYDPRGTFLISNTFADGHAGALLSIAYTDRTVVEEGSDTVRWWTAQNTSTNFFAPDSPFQAALDPNVYHPRIPRYNLYRHEQERLGITGALQFKLGDRTELVFDGLYARFDANRWQDNINAVSFSRTNADGKQETRVLDGEIDSRGNLVYGVFDNVDIRSEGRYDEQNTTFTQLTAALEHGFSDSVKLNALVGMSSSEYDNPIQTTVIADKFNAQGFSWDYRGNSRLPVFDYGSVDPTDTSGWTLAEIRLRPQWVENTFDTATMDLSWAASPYFTLKGGVNYKNYEFKSREWGRGTPGSGRVETVGGITVTPDALASLMRQYHIGGFGSAVVPDVVSFAQSLGIHGGTGPYAVHHYLTNTIANDRSVQEESLGFYVQGDFNFDIGAIPVRGNVGVRRVETELTSTGWINITTPGQVVNKYSDTLPSFNLVAELTPDLLLRVAGAEVMTRPNLGFLGVGTTFSVAGGSRTVTTGNPNVEPFRAKTFDLGLEWYLRDGGLVSVGLFYKDIDSYIQTSRESRPFHTSGLPASLLLPEWNVTPDDEFVFQQPLNTPGGELKGVELGYQQPFTFLPGFWSDFGVQLNYTWVESEIQYLSSSGAPTAKGPMVGLSENAWNATLYYDNQKFSARISAAYRDEYANQIPGREGTDLEGTAATTTIDASLSYNFNDNFSISLEGLNLTDEWSDLWMDTGRDASIAYTHTGRQYLLGFRYKF
ncbi:TonB-dependent receptor [Luteimonas marina]|uniref:TonB-dependent receptor n=1 Tax=Luteimonas marina TaxID=488485 RepID=A0A5C5U9D5_9GAMM|nr:TonB-dependent receptor [Luteimonas marina]TWT22674.1 TonB-dependent receptor [Luteimonas marina]